MQSKKIINTNGIFSFKKDDEEKKKQSKKEVKNKNTLNKMNSYHLIILQTPLQVLVNKTRLITRCWLSKFYFNLLLVHNKKFLIIS